MLIPWGNHPALVGLSPVNEPWRNTPLDLLKDYYRNVRSLMKKYAPDAYFVFHNSYRTAWEDWADLFEPDDRHKVAVDHHHYIAWAFFDAVWMACLDVTQKFRKDAADFRRNGIEVWIGEWSLATDTCATWLGGFNDGITTLGVKCKPVPCPKSYMPEDEFDTSFNRN